MNNAMTPEELLKAENAFIRLYNQGVSVEEIAKRLELELSTVETWGKDLEEAIKKSDYSDFLNVIVQEKDITGTYTYRHNLNLTFSNVEMLKFGLWRLANSNINDKKSGNVKQQAEEYLIFADKYLKEFQYESTKDGAVKYKYDINIYNESENPKNIDTAHAMFDFYNRHVFGLETIIQKSILITHETKDIFASHQNISPYSIKSLVIKNFQGIDLCQVHDIPIDTSWLFISGNNSYGKSTFLRALTIGLLGSRSEEQIITDNIESKIAVEYKNKGQNIINNLWAYGFQSLNHLACYGPSRLQIQAKMSQNDEAEKSTTTYGLFNPDGILLNIESKLIEWYLEKNERLGQVKTLFREVIPYLADIIIQKNKQDDYEVLYVERTEDDDTTTFEPVPFDKLAAGFRSIIGLIGDLLIRFIRKQPDVKQLSDLAGIVLIDELENHLHPKWQYQLPTLLSKAFPNIQFIAATHSVIPILGAPKNSVFLKLNRSKEKGITVERIDIDVANLLPNSILTSPIFDMDTIRPIANEDVGQLRTEDTYDEVVANDEIDKQLRELDNDPSQYPALLQE